MLWCLIFSRRSFVDIRISYYVCYKGKAEMELYRLSATVYGSLKTFYRNKQSKKTNRTQNFKKTHNNLDHLDL